MLANRLGLWHVNLFAFWPLILVLVGGRIFWSAFHPASMADPSGGSSASAVAILGGFDRRLTARAFRRAEVTAFMGGGKLDLRDATPEDGTVIVDVFAVMGGVEIIVPPTWVVDVEVTPFMGGCDDKTRVPAGPPAARLKIRGFVMMGGVDLKN